MKHALTLTVLLLLLTAPAARAQHDQVLIGPLEIAGLLDLPGWFGEDFLAYQPAKIYLDRIPEFLPDVEILCFLGTWCSDSKREVPRMIRILQSRNIPPEKLKMIGLDREKRSPGGEEARYGIDRVPTFIFFRNGEEIGRIVEAPLASLEKDMLGIIDPTAGQGSGEAAPVIIEGDGTDGSDGGVPDEDQKRMQEEKRRLEQERESLEKERQRKEAEQKQK